MILLTRDTMQNPNQSGAEDKFAMNFSNYDTKSLFNATHMGGMNIGLKRSAHEAGFERDIGIPSDVDESLKKEDKSWASSSRDMSHHHLHQQQTHLGQPDSQCHPQQQQQPKSAVLPNGKKTKGRVKIKMEFIDNKLRRYTTFSKRKTGIMKKAYELSTLTGTQVMLLVASETGHVYTFATRKLQPMITSEAGKALIQTCLNSPDPPQIPPSHQQDQRMSATGYEETELSYAVNEEEHKVRQMMYNNSPGNPLTPMHCQNHPISPPLTSPSSSQHAAAVAAVSLALQQSSHPHQYQHHPPPPPHPSVTPHLVSPIPDSHHHMMHSLQNPLSHSDNSIALGVGMHHHTVPGTHIPQSQTPLPPHSPLPNPHSPMGTGSPSSPYPHILHHHPHHHIPTHSR